jgi:hypothetical protein
LYYLYIQKRAIYAFINKYLISPSEEVLAGFLAYERLALLQNERSGKHENMENKTKSGQILLFLMKQPGRKD